MDLVSKQISFSDKEPCIVIGEVGVNHNCDRELLFKLIDAGIDAGLDVIKLQRFVSEEEISTYAAATDYQQKAGVGDNQLAMAKKLELPDAWLVEAFDYCKKRKVGFLCTAFEHSSAEFVAKKLGCKTVKVPSPEISNKPLLQHMAKLFEGMLISTGASYLHECATALSWIEEVGKREIGLMHCLSEYPAPIDQANLRALHALKAAFGLPVGYSDHTPGTTAAIVSVALGAKFIEKHYTLDKNLPGPDHKASLDIPELKQLVQGVKEANSSLGDGIKRPVAAEAANRPLIRKSVTCAVKNMKAGTRIKANMLGIKRPWVEGTVEPWEMERVIGLAVHKEKTYDEPLLWSDFEEK